MTVSLRKDTENLAPFSRQRNIKSSFSPERLFLSTFIIPTLSDLRPPLLWFCPLGYYEAPHSSQAVCYLALRGINHARLHPSPNHIYHPLVLNSHLQNPDPNPIPRTVGFCCCSLPFLLPRLGRRGDKYRHQLPPRCLGSRLLGCQECRVCLVSRRTSCFPYLPSPEPPHLCTLGLASPFGLWLPQNRDVRSGL